MPLSSLSSARIFADALNQYGPAQATIIAPDEGAIGRCEAIRAAAGQSKDPIPYLQEVYEFSNKAN